MATPFELERLVVKLVGESSSYEKMMHNAMVKGGTVAARLNQIGKQVEDATKKLALHGAKATQSAMTSMEKHQDKIKQYDALLRGGAISYETYGRLAKKANDKLTSDLERNFKRSQRANEATARGQQQVNWAKERSDASYVAFWNREMSKKERIAERQARRQFQIDAAMTDATIKRLQGNVKAAEKAVQIEDRNARYIERLRSRNYRDEEQKAAKAAAHVERIRSRAYVQQERELAKATKAAEREAAKRTQAMARGFRSMAQMAENVGHQMRNYITIPIMGAGAAGVKAFSDFDNAMTGSLAVMENVSGTMRKKMEGEALGISSKSITSAKDLAESYYFLASAGLDAEQSLGALSKVEKFAVAGRFQMQKATELLVDSQTALGMRSNDTAQDVANLARVSDVLVKADTIANASVEQFAQSLTSKAGNALRLLNKDVEEGTAVLAAYAAQGVKGHLAGERLYIVLRDLERASRTNTKQFEHFGIRVYDVHGKMRKVAEVVRDMEHAMAGMSDQQKSATFAMLGFQDRSVAALKGLIGMSDQIEYFEHQLRSAGGYTELVANRQLKSFASQCTIVWNQITNMGIQIGEMLLPQLQKLLAWVQRGIDWWKGLSDAQKQVELRHLAILAAIGPTLIGIGQLTRAVLAARTAYLAFSTAMGITNASAFVLKAGLAGLVIGGLYLILRTLSDLNPQVQRFNEMMKEQERLKGLADSANLKDRLKFMEKIQDIGDKPILAQRLAEEESELKSYTSQIQEIEDKLKNWGDTVRKEEIGKGLGLGKMTEELRVMEEYKTKIERLKDQSQKTVEFIQEIRDKMEEISNAHHRPPTPVNMAGEGLDEDVPDYKGLDKAEENAAKQVERMNQKLQIQKDTLGLTAAEMKVYEMALKGADKPTIAAAAEAAKASKAFDLEKKALKEMSDAAEKALHPVEKFKVEQAKLSELFDTGMISLEAYSYQMTELRKNLAGDLNLKFHVEGVEAVRSNSLAALAKVEAFRLGKLLPESAMRRSMMLPGLGEEFKGDRVKGFARGAKMEPVARLETLLEEIEKNTRKERMGGKARPPVDIDFADFGEVGVGEE